jgi:hypothetical protein
MADIVTCPNCGKRNRLPAAAAGTRLRLPQLGQATISLMLRPPPGCPVGSRR